MIDTPGLGDTEGLKADQARAKNIQEVIMTEHVITCIVVVVKVRLTRLTQQLRYVLSQLCAILPRESSSRLALDAVRHFEIKKKETRIVYKGAPGEHHLTCADCNCNCHVKCKIPTSSSKDEVKDCECFGAADVAQQPGGGDF